MREDWLVATSCPANHQAPMLACLVSGKLVYKTATVLISPALFIRAVERGERDHALVLPRVRSTRRMRRHGIFWPGDPRGAWRSSCSLAAIEARHIRTDSELNNGCTVAQLARVQPRGSKGGRPQQWRVHSKLRGGDAA